MPWTQHNSDLNPAGTQSTGKGGQPFLSSITAHLSHFSKSPAQREDPYGVYESEHAREVAKLKREGRM